MTTLREAAQQALEALQNCANGEDDVLLTRDALAALRAALAEPTTEDSSAVETVQEPVAWMVYTEDGKSVCVTDHPADFIEWRSLPLYTHPPQRKPLSAIDLRALYDRHAACQEEGPEISGWWDFARAVEASHGIREEK
jgi:hypothetical protein